MVDENTLTLYNLIYGRLCGPSIKYDYKYKVSLLPEVVPGELTRSLLLDNF